MFAAGEVRSAGWGSLAAVSKITGLARSTINRGEDDLDAAPLPKGQVRRAGGGRRAVCENDPGLVPALKRLVETATLGDPMRPLICVYPVHAITRKSLGDMTRKLSVTESHRFAQLRGTVSRRKPSVASANWVHVA